MYLYDVQKGKRAKEFVLFLSLSLFLLFSLSLVERLSDREIAKKEDKKGASSYGLGTMNRSVAFCI